MTSHVVLPDATRYELSTGDWILVKSRLNAGEYRRMMSRMMGPVHVTPGKPDLTDVPIDPMQAGINIVLAHLLDWSLTDPGGGPMPIRDPLTGDRVSGERLTALLDGLEIDVYNEIESIIQAHYSRSRVVEKKTSSSAPSSPRTSSSPDAATGGTSGSSNSTLMFTRSSSSNS